METISLTDAVIRRIKNPCQHKPETFTVTKETFIHTKYPTDMRKAVAMCLSGTVKKTKHVRWLARCPECKAWYFAADTRRELNQLIKKYYEWSGNELS